MRTPDIDEDESLTEINMVPFIDVMLVLLIVFMVTMPLVHQSVGLELPRPGTVSPSADPQAVTLGIGTQGQLSWNGQAIDRTQLGQRLATTAAQRPQPPLHLAADEATPYQHVAQAMADAQRAGIEKMGFLSLAD